MTQYFVVIADCPRSGPFYSIGDACRHLKQSSNDRGHTDEEAHHFFHFESAVEQVETVDGKVERFHVGWIKPQKKEDEAWLPGMENGSSFSRNKAGNKTSSLRISSLLARL